MDGVESSIASMPIGNPAAPALEALARELASRIDAGGVDERTLPAYVKELRATLADMAPKATGADEDDPFGFGDMSPTVVDPPAV